MDKEKGLSIAKKLNSSVMAVLSEKELKGFEKSYLISSAIKELKVQLDSEYMKPIMELQGNRLGFKTDKDSEGGYSEDVVKNCLIEAVLTGVQPFGNQFNIIAKNCYITKEGFGYLLNNIEGLSWEIIPKLPRINSDKSSAAIVMLISWVYGEVKKEREIEIPIKMNKFMGTDAIIGKAQRKARAWLFNTINGTEIGDGDVMDLDSPIMEAQVVEVDHEAERMKALISNCHTLEDLELIETSNPDFDSKVYDEQRELIKSKTA